MNQPFVVSELRGRIATLTLNRPEVRNAIGTHQDCLDFVAAVRAAQEDDSISCLILTGAGTAFCAGGNLKAMKERNGIGPLPTRLCERARSGHECAS
jgi:2-(1,2-epoxy-1,2-dihydrophenyl)acetyl-CoA isomerase